MTSIFPPEVTNPTQTGRVRSERQNEPNTPKQRKPTMTILVGESGSGKSTLARLMVEDDPKHNTVRVNRDDIRSMLHVDGAKNRRIEPLVISIQADIIETALKQRHDVVVDDTNLNEKTRSHLDMLGQQYGAEVVTHRMETPPEECILRDNLRTGKARVGRAVIERQFLAAGNLPLGDLPIAIVDLDGTLADNHHRSPFDESKVFDDGLYPEIAHKVLSLSYGVYDAEVNPECLYHRILIVSGRHSTCGDLSIQWLRYHKIPFDHIFMRHGWDSRPDTVVKKEILDEILKNTPKDNIKIVIDDRPSVLNMWFDQGLNIYPAREIKEPF